MVFLISYFLLLISHDPQVFVQQNLIRMVHQRVGAGIEEAEDFVAAPDDLVFGGEVRIVAVGIGKGQGIADGGMIPQAEGD